MKWHLAIRVLIVWMCIIVNVNGGGLGTRLISLYPTLWCLSLLLQNEGEEGKTEYRVWNPFRSKLAAAILGEVDKIHIKPGSEVLYLGAASGTTVSHGGRYCGPVRLVCENVAMKLQPPLPPFSLSRPQTPNFSHVACGLVEKQGLDTFTGKTGA